jgi:hypothetical protein
MQVFQPAARAVAHELRATGGGVPLSSPGPFPDLFRADDQPERAPDRPGEGLVHVPALGRHVRPQTRGSVKASSQMPDRRHLRRVRRDGRGDGRYHLASAATPGSTPMNGLRPAHGCEGSGPRHPVLARRPDGRTAVNPRSTRPDPMDRDAPLAPPPDESRPLGLLRGGSR